jgi:hypothetical protein
VRCVRCVRCVRSEAILGLTDFQKKGGRVGPWSEGKLLDVRPAQGLEDTSNSPSILSQQSSNPRMVPWDDPRLVNQRLDIVGGEDAGSVWYAERSPSPSKQEAQMGFSKSV